MSCKFTRDKDGASMIVCSKDIVDTEMQELKKAKHCRRWETCKGCNSYQQCKKEFK